MKIHLIIALALFSGSLSRVAWAQDSLRVRALTESETPKSQKKAKSDASDAQVENPGVGVLQLEDPTPRERTRKYNWMFGVKVQNYQASGQLQSDAKQNLELSHISPFYLPSLEVGWRAAPHETDTALWHWGFLAHAGYGTKNSHLELYSGGNDTEAMLTTLLADSGIFIDYEPLMAPWGVEASFGLGNIHYLHSGSSSYSSFSDQAQFRFASLGGHLNVWQKWQIFLSYNNRNILNSDNARISMPTDSLELGTRIIW